MTQALRIDICCNDPDNGLFDGRCASIALESSALDLCAQTVRAPKLRVTADAIFVSGRRYEVLQSKDWLGNWAWNAYWLPLDQALDLLLWTKTRFSADGGWVDVLTAIEAGDRQRLFAALEDIVRCVP